MIKPKPMHQSRHRLGPPGRGFVLVCLSYALLAGAALRALARPDADAVWELYQQLRTGQQQILSPEDLALIGRAMRQQPGLVPALLGGRQGEMLTPHRAGWIHAKQALLLRAPGGLGLRLNSPDTQVALRMTGFDGSGWTWERRLTVSPGQAALISLPPALERGELVRIELSDATRLQFAFQEAR